MQSGCAALDYAAATNYTQQDGDDGNYQQNVDQVVALHARAQYAEEA